MAFSVYATVDSATTQLNDGDPFRVESMEGLSGAGIVRHSQRGPSQHGVSDLAFRLDPRVVTLNLLFHAVDGSTLDGYRDTLADVFKPLETIATTLVVERDDGDTRQLACHRVGEIAIALVPEHRPGNLHRATITLRAASPLWSDASVTQSTFSGTALNWWTAGTAIPAVNVLEHVENPTQGQQWTYAGTVPSGSAWSIVFRSGQEPEAGTVTAFHAGSESVVANASPDARFYYDTTKSAFRFDRFDGPNIDMVAGTHNYIIVHEQSTFLHAMYVNGTTEIGTASIGAHIGGTARRWRSDRLNNPLTYWTNELPKAAVYDIALSQSQRIALDGWINGTAIIGTFSAVNAGDVPAYPYITLSGPLVDPILTNTTTGGSINLTGLTLGTTDICVIDLRTGNKQVLDSGGSSLLGSVTNMPVSLANFYLAPAPTATGGTNTIRIQGVSSGTTTSIVVEHTNQYMSF